MLYLQQFSRAAQYMQEYVEMLEQANLIQYQLDDSILLKKEPENLLKAQQLWNNLLKQKGLLMPAIQDTITLAIATRLQAADYTENDAARSLSNDLILIEMHGPKGWEGQQASAAALNLYKEIERLGNSVDMALRDLAPTGRQPEQEQ